MRAALLALIAVIPVVVFASCSEKKESGGGGGSKSDTSAVTAGTLAVVTGEIQPADGADPSTVSGALIAAEGHPEISALADETGKFTIENVLPGTVSLYVGSNDGGAALQEGAAIGPTAYGLKLPDVVLKSGEVTDLGQQLLKKTGGFSGKVVFYSNPNKLDLVGSEVFVPGTGFIVKTDATGAFTLSGLPPGTYDLRAQHTGFAVLDIKDVSVNEGETSDLGNLALSISTGPEGSIAVVEDLTAHIGENQKAKIVKTRTAKLTLKFDSDAALMKVADEPSFTNKEWIPVKTSLDWTFNSDGLKTVYVMYSDLNGLESSPYKDDVYIDTLPPTLNSVYVMRNWVQTAKLAVDVDVNATDGGSGVANVYFSNENNSDWSDAIAFGTRLDWQLAAGVDGPRTVYAKVVDFSGRESTIKSDLITKGAYTKVTEKAYDETLVFKKKHSPYLFYAAAGDNLFTVSDDVVIEAGVELNVEGNGSTPGRAVTFLGTVSAVGAASDPIVVRSAATDGQCGADIRFDQGLPGVSEASAWSHIKFLNVARIYFSGGTVKSSSFVYDDDSGALCADLGADRHGAINKSGDELLTLQSPTFELWYQVLRVDTGSGTSKIIGGNGTAETLLMQNSPGSHVEFTGPSVYTYPNFGYLQQVAFNLGRGHLKVKDVVVNGAYLQNGGGPGVHQGLTGLTVTDAAFVESIDFENVTFDTGLAGIMIGAIDTSLADLTFDNITIKDFDLGLSVSGNSSFAGTGALDTVVTECQDGTTGTFTFNSLPCVGNAF